MLNETGILQSFAHVGVVSDARPSAIVCIILTKTKLKLTTINLIMMLYYRNNFYFCDAEVCQQAFNIC